MLAAIEICPQAIIRRCPVAAILVTDCD